MASTPKAGVTTGTQVPAKAPQAAFPPFDQSGFVPQLIWLALTFGFLYFALSRFLLPRISEVIDARQDAIARDLAKAEQLKADTDKALADYEKALADAKSKANDIAKTTRDGLTAEVDRERQKIETELNSRVVASEKRIAESKAKAMTSVGSIANDTAAAIVAKLTGQTVSKEDIDKAIAAVRTK